MHGRMNNGTMVQQLAYPEWCSGSVIQENSVLVASICHMHSSVSGYQYSIVSTILLRQVGTGVYYTVEE